MREDLFNSMMSRADLAKLYVRTYEEVHGYAPSNVSQLNRARLVGRIETLNDTLASKRSPAVA